MAAERALACVTDRIVAVGERVRDDLLRAGVGRPEQYEVIAPGVELPAPPPTRAEARRLLGLPPGARVVGFTGRLIRIKRPDRIVELARRLPDAVVVIAGEGSLYPEVAATAPRNLRLLGWRPDVQVVHAACDLAVLTSDNEGMPLSLIEAALCGVPAVTTAVGSAGEVVLDGETGLVVDVDPATFADAVGRLLADDGLRLRMGLAARVRAETEFSVRRMVDAHVHLYQRILHEKPLKASRR
jgi:glycosyltransferase involved in cell wall biosynthesis